jgi:tRNA (guanine37-N1)-methyltransferase
MSNFHATILTLFPEMFPGPLGYSLAGKALHSGLWSYEIINIRDFGIGRHKQVDDEPYGGGDGLVMRADVISSAVEEALSRRPESKIYYMSPRGSPLEQSKLQEMVTANSREIIIICGRYAGIDERVIHHYNISQISLGDYILSGGEIAAMALIDGCVRLLEGVVSTSESVYEDSFTYAKNNDIGLLEYPQYSRPGVWNGYEVPELLLSGDHKAIENWRLEKAEQITKETRPDIWRKYKSGK